LRIDKLEPLRVAPYFDARQVYMVGSFNSAEHVMSWNSVLYGIGVFPGFLIAPHLQGTCKLTSYLSPTEFGTTFGATQHIFV
jgi:hypothetical protein